MDAGLCQVSHPLLLGLRVMVRGQGLQIRFTNRDLVVADGDGGGD